MQKEKNTGKKRVLRYALLLLFLLLVIGAAVAGTVIVKVYFPTDAEEIFAAGARSRPPVFYYYRFSDRTERIGERVELPVGGIPGAASTTVPEDGIPKVLADAFVAIEDRRFYDHRGVDWLRTARAAFNWITGDKETFGASTITQQLVKNLTDRREVTADRKLREIFTALELERNHEKQEILCRYLNVIPFSDGCYGVADAAKHYFSKRVDELTVSECASLAAIPNSPATYHPVKHPEEHLSRRNLVLDEMFRQGYLDEETYRNAREEPLRLSIDPTTAGDGIQSWYLDMVIEDVVNDLCAAYGLSREEAYRKLAGDGLSVEIAMDPEIQTLAEDYYRTVIRTPENRDGVRAQSAMIVLDAGTGDILAVVGAIGEKTGNRVQNYATQTLRPPGSALKPISVYSPALEKGIINWATVFDDVPLDFGKDGQTPWPRNATGVYRGLTDIAYAVAHSTNTVAVRVLERLGTDASFVCAKERFHLSHLIDKDRDVAALALGQLNYGITLRELSAAYTVFVDRGLYHPARSYYRVTDREGKILLSMPDTSERVLSEGNAAIMTKLLQGVITDGTSSSVTLNDLTECAGKTGTTNGDCDRWFIGFTPDTVCGVWCGYEYPEPLDGKNLCTTVWNNVMHGIVGLRDGAKVFPVPSGVTRAVYCADSGKLPGIACAHDPRGDRTKIGWFLTGDLPQTVCRTHVLCDYDAVCGGISHGFCPTENLTRAALIRTRRSFPIPVEVSDAQYSYLGDPRLMTPSPDPSKSYASASDGEERGYSDVPVPYHHSCTCHTKPPEPENEAEPEPTEEKWYNLWRRFIK